MDDPDKVLLDNLNRDIDSVKQQAKSILSRSKWGCGKCGQFRIQPKNFTKREFLDEINRVTEHKYSGSCISLAIHALIDENILEQDMNFKLSKMVPNE